MRDVLIIAAVLGLAACDSAETPAPVSKTVDAATTADHAARSHDTAAATPGDSAFAASEAEMHTLMTAASGETLDQSYIAKMIAHHQGAVAMADVALARSQDPEILRMAQTVKDAQTVEIAEMRAWQPTTATTAAE